MENDGTAGVREVAAMPLHNAQSGIIHNCAMWVLMIQLMVEYRSGRNELFSPNERLKLAQAGSHCEIAQVERLKLAQLWLNQLLT